MMDVRLHSDDVQTAILEYVQRRVTIPQGYHVETQGSYFSSVTVDILKDDPLPAAPELPDADYAVGLTDGTAD